MPDIDVDALLKAEVESSAKAMCYKTVDVFAGICERKLWLKDAPDGQPKTNGFLIEVPFRHPRAYQYTEHEISHILFQSDAIAKQKFVEEYAKKIGQVAKKAGHPINERMLRGGLDGIIGILDDERVISLWGLLYRGSEAIMRRMKADEAAPYMDRSHEDFLTLLSAVASGNQVPDGKLDRFTPYMREALRKVHLRDYYGCLVAAKWLVVQLVSEIIRESRGEDPPAGPTGFGQGDDGQTSPHPVPGSGGLSGVDEPREAPQMPWEADDGSEGSQEPAGGHGEDAWEPPKVSAGVDERSEALQQTIDRLGNIPDHTMKAINGEITESKYKRRGEEQAAERKARAAINAEVKDSGKLEASLESSADRMMGLVKKARHATKNAPNHDDRIRQEAFAKVVFKDVDPSEHRDPHLGLNDEDEDTVRRLRALFHRVMGRRANTLEDAGAQIDIPAYIERRMTGEPLPVFRVDCFGRGFRTMILVDRSSSMQGPRTAKAERACRIISRALDFPFVTRSVWGFQSWKDGEVDITRFRAGQEIFESDAAMVGGVTPLHTAIRVALKELEDGTDKKHLFVISDGFPIFARRDGAHFGTKTLMGFVRGNVMGAREKGIGVTGVLVGGDLDHKSMAFMFGPSKYWRIMGDDTFGGDLVQLVTGAFVEYLRAA